MRIAITGASGYVGSRLCQRLEREGHEILRLSRRPCEGTWVPFSLSSSPTDLPLSTIDVLIHAAYDFTSLDWDMTVETNVNPSIKLLQASRKAGVKQILFISSMSSFEGCRSVYGRAKFMIERAALSIGCIVLRPGLVWGNEAGGVMGALERALFLSPVLPYPSGSGGLPQYLVHEEDLTDTITEILSTDQKSDVISIAQPTPVTLHTVLETIAFRHGKRRFFIPIPWQIPWVALQVAERIGITLSFRSDSLLGLAYGNRTTDTTFFTGDFRTFS